MTADELVNAFHLPPAVAQDLLQQMSDAKNPDAVDKVLEKLNEELEGFGVEALELEGLWDRYYCNIGCLYVNLGDPYKTTVWYDTRTNQFGIGSWGDWYETHENDEKEVEEPAEEEEMETTKEAPGSFGALAEEGLMLFKSAETLLNTYKTQLDEALRQVQDQRQLTERAIKVAEDLVAERERAMATLVTMRMKRTHVAATVAGELVRRGCWFQVTPLPDDCYDFTIKAEKDVLGLLRDFGAEEVKVCGITE